MAETDSMLEQMFREKAAGMDFSMKQEAKEDTGYPSGFLNFDYQNGFINDERLSNGELHPYYVLGITDGSYNAFIGNTGCGKSTLVTQIAANIARQYKTSTIFEDNIEGGMTSSRRRSLSGFSVEEYEKRYIVRNTGITAENFYERIKMIHDLKLSNVDKFLYDTKRNDVYGKPIMKLEPTLYIIDSIPMLMPKEYIDDDELAGKSSGAATAQILTRIFRQIIPLLKEANIILFGINHILEDVQMSIFPKPNAVQYLKQGERLPRGRSSTYVANNIIRLDAKSKLKADETYKVEGSVVELSLVKSRSSGKKTGTRLVFDYNNGFDPWLSLLEDMKNNKLLYGGGASLSFDSDKIHKFSYGNFREKINENPEFRSAFVKAALGYLKKIPQRIILAENLHTDDLLTSDSLYEVE